MCLKQFPKLCKLKQHEVVQSRHVHTCFNCGRKFKRWDHMTTHQTKCSHQVDEKMQENNKDNDNYQIVPSMLCTREEIELVQKMHADNYHYKTQTSVTECVNDANLNHNLGDSLEIESSSTELLYRKTLTQKSGNLANVVQKIFNVNMQPTDQAKVLRKSLETSVNQTMMDHLMLPAGTINHNKSNCCLEF